MVGEMLTGFLQLFLFESDSHRVTGLAFPTLVAN